MYQMIYTRRTGLQLSIMAVSDAVSVCGMSMLCEPHGDRLPWSAATRRGLWMALVVPSPNWPSSLSPQVYTSPKTTQVYTSPKTTPVYTSPKTTQMYTSPKEKKCTPHLKHHKCTPQWPHLKQHKCTPHLKQHNYTPRLNHALCTPHLKQATSLVFMPSKTIQWYTSHKTMYKWLLKELSRAVCLFLEIITSHESAHTQHTYF